MGPSDGGEVGVDAGEGEGEDMAWDLEEEGVEDVGGVERDAPVVNGCCSGGGGDGLVEWREIALDSVRDRQR